MKTYYVFSIKAKRCPYFTSHFQSSSSGSSSELSSGSSVSVSGGSYSSGSFIYSQHKVNVSQYQSPLAAPGHYDVAPLGQLPLSHLFRS